jgi:excinuclease ABC subunit C
MSEPIRIPRGSEALYLLQRVRDEAHRFAITFHRERRAKSMTVGALEGIPGLGPTRAKRLLAHAGSLKALRAMSREELRSLSWLPDPVAEAVYARLLVGARSRSRPEGPRRASVVGPD